MGGGGLGQSLEGWATLNPKKAMGGVFGNSSSPTQIDPYSGMPVRPEFNSLLDPSTGLIQDKYQSQFAPDMRGMDAVRERALATGPSAWAGQALQNQGLEEQGLKNSTQRQGASANAQARSSLASKFGLSPAAQARLAMSQQRDQMANLQNVGFQGAQARGNIGLQDIQQKNQFLSALPGQELQLAQGNTANQQFNLKSSMDQVAQKNAADIAAYNSQMQAWAGGKQAEATQAAGGGGKHGGMLGK